MVFAAETDASGRKTGSGLIGRNRLAVIFTALLALVAIVAGSIYLATIVFGTGSSQQAGQSGARTYRSSGRVELRADPSPASAVVVTLKEDSIVSGRAAGTVDGVAWLQVIAVDGASGYAPQAQFVDISSSAANNQITGGLKRIVTSTLVNLREAPSLSAKIIGVAEGGTRLVADGSVTSEGEPWLRVPLDGNTTVFVMQRFTTADDDGGSAEGFEGNNGAFGVQGHAIAIVNVQATPLNDARVVRALQVGEQVRVIGQTNAEIAWYVLRLADGSQGFAPKAAIKIDQTESRWVYPDGTEAPGPNIPQGQTKPIAAAVDTASNGVSPGATRTDVATDGGQDAQTDGDPAAPGSNPTPDPAPALPPQ